MEPKTTRKYAKASNRVPSYRLTIVKENEVEYDNRVQIRCPTNAVDFIKPYFKDVFGEEVHAIYLNTAHHVIGHKVISVGGLDSSIIDPIMVISPGYLMGASAVILVHNHPSGNTEPSLADIKITKQMSNAGKLCRLPLRDHLIIADAGFTSLAERGMC